jgi:phosphomannomutase
MLVAEYLGADAVVVPISCNDGIDRGTLRERLCPKTRIGSPHVIAGMLEARRKGRQRVVGWEANGGFLTGSDIERGGRRLRALPTRDALLPILAVLAMAATTRRSLSSLFAALPQRYSKAALLRRFPREVSERILRRYSPADTAVVAAQFESEDVRGFDAGGALLPLGEPSQRELRSIRQGLEAVFVDLEAGRIQRLDWTDGVRIGFASGEVAHFRPSGNADELRIYAVADSQERADAIARSGVAEPSGVLRRLEQAVS